MVQPGSQLTLVSLISSNAGSPVRIGPLWDQHSATGPAGEFGPAHACGSCGETLGESVFRRRRPGVYVLAAIMHQTTFPPAFW
jgi:hypothetical protein